MKFWMIVRGTEIVHLSFNRIFHRQALARMAEITPMAAPSGTPTEIDRIREIVRQLLSPGPQSPAPDFELNPFLGNGSEFQRKIWRLISRIGPGETITYGELASAAGSPGGARAAGNACNRNPLALIIPCHRVVAVNGLGGFAGDLRIKRILLELEKAPVKRQTRRDPKVKCLVEKLQDACHL